MLGVQGLDVAQHRGSPLVVLNYKLNHIRTGGVLLGTGLEIVWNVFMHEPDT